jgi:hypothetical protein
LRTSTSIAAAQYQNFLNLSESYKKDEQVWIEKIKEYKQVAKSLEVKNNDLQAEISKIEMTEFSLRKHPGQEEASGAFCWW